METIDDGVPNPLHEQEHFGNADNLLLVANESL
jgi:hypothetical protein